MGMFNGFVERKTDLNRTITHERDNEIRRGTMCVATVTLWGHDPARHVIIERKAEEDHKPYETAGGKDPEYFRA